MILLPVLPTISVGGTPLGPTEPTVLTGGPPHLRVAGLPRGAEITLHAFRSMAKQTFDAKWNMTLVTVPLHAWAVFRADRRGEVDVDTARPVRGSYRTVSPQGLFWSGYPADDSTIPAEARRIAFDPPKPSARVFLTVERDGEVLATGTIRLSDESPDTVFTAVDEPGLNGVFACPKDAKARPVVISLHGSEGGSAESARSRAATFAARGFACLALNYFAYDYLPIKGVPTANLDTPVEGLARARDWLATRPECDPGRIALEGVSKGAEFAVLGAATYRWVKAVVAVVPSDVVWEGYGSPGTPRDSSWSFEGRPLPYIPVDAPDPKRFRNNTDRYETSRRDHPKEAKAAEIPVERSRARFLLLGSDRDEVWASGAQVRRLARRLGRRAEWVVFPTAGHQLSGPGAFPPRLYGAPSTDPRDKDLTAEGAAAEASWYRTLAFLRARL